jgi:hypothetical protein
MRRASDQRCMHELQLVVKEDDEVWARTRRLSQMYRKLYLAVVIKCGHHCSLVEYAISVCEHEYA